MKKIFIIHYSLFIAVVLLLASCAKKPAEQQKEAQEQPQANEFKEPELDFNQAVEDDEPIEIHPANEKEPDLFASNGGSPTSFFG